MTTRTAMAAAPKTKREVNWPTTDEGWCAWWKALDLTFITQKDSPLHHDNRCALHARRAA